MLSIIVVSYNTKQLLHNCLKSIEKNRKELKSVEVIVVDNGSTDGSKEYLKTTTKDLKVIFNDRNLGFAEANNQGIKIAKGKYVLLLNSDTVVKAGALKQLVEFAEEKPDAGVIGSQLLNPDDSVQPSCYHSPSIFGAVKEFWLGQKGAFTKYAPGTKEPVAVDAVVGAAFLIRKEVIDKIGLLDEQYFMYFEDLDYCRRAWRAGYKVYYLPGAEIIHLHGASGKKLKSKPNQWLIESSKIYHGKFRHYLINFIIWLGQKYQRLEKFKY